MSEGSLQSGSGQTALPANGTLPELAWNATRYEIVLTRVFTESVALRWIPTEGPFPSDKAPLTVLEVTGRAGKMTEDWFLAYVDWRLSSGRADGLCEGNGVIGLEFSHKVGLETEGVNYYCQVNAPVLAYPYIRELIAHLTGGHVGGPLIVAPLDVPKFVAEARARWASGFVEKLRPRNQESSRAADVTSRDNGA